jgi:hypothetical protein
MTDQWLLVDEFDAYLLKLVQGLLDVLDLETNVE